MGTVLNYPSALWVSGVRFRQQDISIPLQVIGDIARCYKIPESKKFPRKYWKNLKINIWSDNSPLSYISKSPPRGVANCAKNAWNAISDVELCYGSWLQNLLTRSNRIRISHHLHWLRNHRNSRCHGWSRQQTNFSHFIVSRYWNPYRELLRIHVVSIGTS